MALQVRRVITGHDAAGRAIVKIDEVSRNLASARPGASRLRTPEISLRSNPIEERVVPDSNARQRGNHRLS